MTNTKLREQVNKALDFFTEPGQGEKYLKDLEDELLTLFRTTLQEIVPENWKLSLKSGGGIYEPSKTAGHTLEYWDGYNAAIDQFNANIKDILGGE